MDLKSPNTLMSLAALVMAGLALSMSMVNTFPGLKTLLAVVRDAVLWMALFFIVGIVAYIGYQRIERLPQSSSSQLSNTQSAQSVGTSSDATAQPES